MRWHNLGTVVSFEVRRTLKRRSFWVTTLAVPALLVALASLVVFSNNQALASADAGPSQAVTFTYTDASGLIDPVIARAAGGSPAADAAAARADVVRGASEMFVAFPADPTRQPIEVAGRDRGLTRGGEYGALARRVLLDSARAKVPEPMVTGVLTGDAYVHTVTYAGGVQTPGPASMILPGAFLVLFYAAIIMLGNQMLNITVEEKENRVTEMILTTIHPTTLIVGKLAALVAIGVIQTLVLAGPMMGLPGVITALAPTSIALPSGAGAAASSGSLLPTAAEVVSAVNPPAIALGAVLFIGAFLLFTGLLVSIGAIMPTAKDANSAFAGIIVALFLPFYAIGVLLADAHGLASQVLTFFPLTAPVTAMIRNATGTLAPWEAAVSLVSIFGSAALFLALGIRLFATGAISYDVRLDVRKVLSSRRGTG